MKHLSSGQLIELRLPINDAMPLVARGVAKFADKRTQAEASRLLQTFQERQRFNTKKKE
jgi:hypothetical protein